MTEKASCNSPATAENANSSNIKVLPFRSVLGGTNLMPPETGQLAMLLIIIKLAEYGVLGDLHEAPIAAALRERAFRLPLLAGRGFLVSAT